MKLQEVAVGYKRPICDISNLTIEVMLKKYFLSDKVCNLLLNCVLESLSRI